jgi:hypothetical protein
MSTMDNTLPPPPTDPSAPLEVAIQGIASRTSLDLVVAGFNPSRDMLVGRIKLLTAVLMTECEKLRAREFLPEKGAASNAPSVPNVAYNEGLRRGQRWASEAITHYETAAMFAVKAATAVESKGR